MNTPLRKVEDLACAVGGLVLYCVFRAIVMG
jgi:hypothetical protein